jgi:hypothetical protein
MAGTPIPIPVPRAMLLDVESKLDPELGDDVVEVKLLVALLVIEGRLGEFNDVAEDDATILDVKTEDGVPVDAMLENAVAADVRVLVPCVVAGVLL